VLFFYVSLNTDQYPIQFEYKNLVSDQKTQLASQELHFTVSHQVMFLGQRAKIVTQSVHVFTSQLYGVNTVKEKFCTVALCQSTSYHRYSDSLWARQSGDEIPVRARLSAAP